MQASATFLVMEKLQKAIQESTPRLLKLKLEDCPKLRALLRQLGEDTVNLKEFFLEGTKNLKVVEEFPLLSELLVDRCEGLERISNLPQVTHLKVLCCPNLSYVEGLGSLPQLGLGEDMQEISSRWVPGLQKQSQLLHGEELDVYPYSTS